MSAISAERALLPEGWARNVCFEVSADGVLTGIRPDVNANGAECLGGAVLPEMPNLHSYAFQRAMAGLTGIAGNPSDSFWAWRELMYRTVVRLSPEQIEVIAHQLYIEMLKAGYTAAAEFHYVHHDLDGRSYVDSAELSLHISRTVSAVGIGLTLFPVLYGHMGFGGQSADEGQRRLTNGSEAYLELLQCLHASLDAAGHSLGPRFRSLRAVTPQQIATVLTAGHGDLPAHIHVAEQRKEVDDYLTQSGHRPLRWLYKNVAVGQRWCLVHAIHADPDEAAVMAYSGVMAGLCLSTKANLGDDIFLAMNFLTQGRYLGIGSDSHVSLSVVEELRWLEYSQRLCDRRRNRLYRDDQLMIGRTLYDATLAGGAQAPGQLIDSFAASYRAGLLVLDDNDPYLISAEDDALLNHWLFAGSDHRIRDVMVAGRRVVRDGRHAGEERSARAFVQMLGGLLN